MERIAGPSPLTLREDDHIRARPHGQSSRSLAICLGGPVLRADKVTGGLTASGPRRTLGDSEEYLTIG